MYILDTDHVTILQHPVGPDFDSLAARLQQISEAQIFVTIISFHEQANGWNSYLASASQPAEI